jgi:hypothetical protein
MSTDRLSVGCALSPRYRKIILRNQRNFPCKLVRLVLTFAQLNGEAKCTMVSKKKYVMPEINREEAGPQAAELIAFTEELTARANTVHEELLALRAELARVKRAKKRRASRTPK